MYTQKLVVVDEVTLAVFEVIAGEWKMEAEDCMTQVLFQQAAQISGWPGLVGSKCRLALQGLRLGLSVEEAVGK